jgi:hypothetical protein
MYTFLAISVDGTDYMAFIPETLAPVGEIGGLVFAGLAAVGLMWMQFRRRSRRTRPSPAQAI